MKLVTRIVFAVSFMFASVANANVILSVNPGTQATQPGDEISVIVSIEGLGDGVPLSLSAFDIIVEFDSSALSFAGYSLFDDLGVVDALDPLADATDESFGDIGGAVWIAELSYLDTFDLWDFQPASFDLFELFFVVETTATNVISIADAVLVDAGFDAGLIAFETTDATVTHASAPATLSLMGLALLAMFTRQKRILSVIKKS